MQTIIKIKGNYSNLQDTAKKINILISKIQMPQELFILILLSMNEDSIKY
jgi:hypothetical protein